MSVLIKTLDLSLWYWVQAKYRISNINSIKIISNFNQKSISKILIRRLNQSEEIRRPFTQSSWEENISKLFDNIIIHSILWSESWCHATCNRPPCYFRQHLLETITSMLESPFWHKTRVWEYTQPHLKYWMKNILKTTVGSHICVQCDQYDKCHTCFYRHIHYVGEDSLRYFTCQQLEMRKM